MATFFGGFVLVCGIALAFVGWVLLKDSTKPLEETAPVETSLEKTTFISFFLNKLSFLKRSQEEVAIEKYIPPPPPAFQTASAAIAKPDIKTDLSQDEEKHIEEEIDATIHVHELKEKYERLDHLFKEKASDLEKTQKALETEVRTKKEFNKVKDILEKELKDTKDKVRSVQVELISARTEAESYKKRIGQLETKATKLEKEILDKEKEIEELLKKQAKLMEEAKKTTIAHPAPKPAPPPEAPVENPPAASAQEDAAVTENITVPPEPPKTEPTPQEKEPSVDSQEEVSVEKKPEEITPKKASEEKEKVDKDEKGEQNV